jgi:transposase
MSNQRYSPEFKDEAVRQILQRGYSVAEVSQRLGVSVHSLHKWVKAVKPDKSVESAAELKEAKREILKLRAELRRNVLRMAALYSIAAWLIVQVVEVVMDLAKLSDWIGTTTLWLLVIGFPIALIFSWFYELTPEGITREKHVDPQASITRVTDRGSLSHCYAQSARPTDFGTIAQGRDCQYLRWFCLLEAVNLAALAIWSFFVHV